MKGENIMDAELLPEPLVSAEVDLRDFQFMPLEAARLRDSDLSALAAGDEFRAAVLLWCVAWHQVPASSLPDDDRVLASFVGYARTPKEWQKVKREALRGFVKCNDGRLYHAVIAEKAAEAWKAKQAQRARTEAARLARANARGKKETFGGLMEENSDQSKALSNRAANSATERPIGAESIVTSNVASPVTSSVTENVTGSKGQGQGQGDSKEEESLRASSGAARENEIRGLADEIWAMARITPAAFRASGQIADVEAIASWMAAGATPDEIRRACKTVIGRNAKVKSLWGLLKRTIPETLDAERAIASAPPEKPKDTAYRARCRLRLRLYVETGRWPDVQGFPPTDERCDCPPDILAEFGFGRGLVTTTE